ncbi:MAG: hypothetical protein H7Y15_09670, partial [Pseudonocardia sp.]|nr:hypothetical protein [Pseudonocardia sp.]
DDRLALFPPAHDGVPSGPGDVWQDPDRASTPPDRGRRRNLVIGIGALAVAVLVVLGFVGVQVTSLFSDRAGPAIVVAAPSGGAEQPQQEPPPPAGPAGIAAVRVVDEVGDRDNSGQAARVIDGNPTTTWSTVTYQQQLPALKPGIGIMASFASAVQLSEVAITSPSAGTRVEVRSAPSADAPVDDTEVIARATLDQDTTVVPLDGSQPVGHVLIWIVGLDGGAGDYSSEVGELEFRRAG